MQDSRGHDFFDLTIMLVLQKLAVSVKLQQKIKCNLKVTLHILIL
jgi:hypothetical protein